MLRLTDKFQFEVGWNISLSLIINWQAISESELGLYELVQTEVLEAPRGEVEQFSVLLNIFVASSRLVTLF